MYGSVINMNVCVLQRYSVRLCYGFYILKMNHIFLLLMTKNKQYILSAIY
jgi:hypothetical protein